MASLLCRGLLRQALSWVTNFCLLWLGSLHKLWVELLGLALRNTRRLTLVLSMAELVDLVVLKACKEVLKGGLPAVRWLRPRESEGCPVREVSEVVDLLRSLLNLHRMTSRRLCIILVQGVRHQLGIEEAALSAEDRRVLNFGSHTRGELRVYVVNFLRVLREPDLQVGVVGSYRDVASYPFDGGFFSLGQGEQWGLA